MPTLEMMRTQEKADFLKTEVCMATHPTSSKAFFFGTEMQMVWFHPKLLTLLDQSENKTSKDFYRSLLGSDEKGYSSTKG